MTRTKARTRGVKYETAEEERGYKQVKNKRKTTRDEARTWSWTSLMTRV